MRKEWGVVVERHCFGCWAELVVLGCWVERLVLDCLEEITVLGCWVEKLDLGCWVEARVLGLQKHKLRPSPLSSCFAIEITLSTAAVSKRVPEEQKNSATKPKNERGKTKLRFRTERS